MSNVTVADSTVHGTCVQFRVLSDSSVIAGLSFERVVSDGPLLEALTPLSVTDLSVRDCVGYGGLISLSQSSHLAGFEATNNVLNDDYGVLLNLGKLYLRNSMISGTRVGKGDNTLGSSSAIVNRGYLYLENAIFSSNEVCAITSSQTAHIFMSEFSENMGSSQIFNSGWMIVDGCKFSGKTLTIASDSDIVLRNSILPEGYEPPHLECNETSVLPDGSAQWACGFNAMCSKSVYSGVNCTCAPGHLGSPLVMCGPPAAVHVLPDPSVVAFVTKNDNGNTSVEVLGLVSDGLGTVMWHVVEETLPYWAQMSPRNGSFINDDPCLSELVTLLVSFSAADVFASDPIRTGIIDISTESAYGGSVLYNTVEINMQMIVEVPASSSTSLVSGVGACVSNGGDGICEVEAGSTVSVVVDLLDSSGHSLGVGGTGFGVDPAPLASIDYENGTHVVTFEAPQTHFDITVTLSGAHVQGSPLSYHVTCAKGDVWSDELDVCVADELHLPRVTIAVVAVSAFICASAVVFYSQSLKMEIKMTVLQKEACLSVFWIFVDLVDIGTDIGAYWSVSTTDSLSSFAPWYLAVLCVSMSFSLCSLGFRVRSLNAILADSSQHFHRSEYVYDRPISVAGVHGFLQISDAQDLAFAMRQLKRKYWAHVLSVIGLFVEDVPMQVLNTIMLCTLGSDYPVEVLVSTEVTCILIGVKMTKFYRMRRIGDGIRRLRSKAQQRRLSLMRGAAKQKKKRRKQLDISETGK
eukprot:Rmarinus@m.11402